MSDIDKNPEASGLNFTRGEAIYYASATVFMLVLLAAVAGLVPWWAFGIVAAVAFAIGATYAIVVGLPGIWSNT